MIQSPEHKRPVRSMPQPTQNKNYGHVHACSSSPPAVAAERNVEIISKPFAQSNMPSTPKVRDTYCRIGAIEIFWKCEAKHKAKTYSHVGVGGEIEIDLKGIGNRAEPGAFCIEQG